MKILVVHGRYRSAAPSGENRVVDLESEALRSMGHEVGLFERRSDDIEGWSVGRKLTLPILNVWNAEVHRDLVRRLRAERPDVVHVHNTFPIVSPAVLHACRDEGAPVVVTLHNKQLLCAKGDFFREGQVCHECITGRLSPALQHGCYRGSRLATLPVTLGLAVHRESWRHLVSAYIFITEAQRTLMQGLGLDPERVFVKHNLVPPAAPQLRREHRVVYLGRFDEAKGVPLLMRAWDSFLQANPAAALRLVLAGGGPLEADVRRWAARRPSVEMAGLLNPTEASRLLRGSLAVLLPSQVEETFGLVAIEAMVAGVAPIAVDHGSFPELITHGADGVLFTPHSPDALARVLADVERHPAVFEEYGRRGLVTYARRFESGDNLEQLARIYRFAKANPVGGPATRHVPS